MRDGWREIRNFRKSFTYAIRGFVQCVRTERNMRVHIVAAVVVILFSLIFELSKIEFGLLCITIGLIIVCEMINTAIETLVNLSSPSYHGLAKAAKDVAAGAVLFASIISIAVSCILFLKPKKLIKTFNEILTSPHLISIFSIIVVLGLIFIFKGFKVNLFIKSEYVDEVKIYKPKKKKKFEL